MSITGEDTEIGELNPIRYRGYYQDVETGLYYLQSRYCDPMTMRFINADDPNVIQMGSTEKQELNLYVYCVNDPVNGVDPTGEFVQAIVSGVFGAIVGAFTYWLEWKLGMRNWNGWVFAGHIVLSAGLGAAGAHFRYWAKLSNLAAKIATKLHLIKGVKSYTVIKFVIDLGSRGITFAINAIAKKFIRKPGESWGKLIKRQFGW